MSEINDIKYFTVLNILNIGNCNIHFDPRLPEVIVPDTYRDVGSMVLEFGSNMAVPITRFSIDRFGIGGDLSFNRVATYCWLPWESVFIVNIAGTTKGQVWQDSFPKDYLNNLDEKKVKKPNPNSLKAIKGGKTDDGQSKRKTGHLRLV